MFKFVRKSSSQLIFSIEIKSFLSRSAMREFEAAINFSNMEVKIDGKIIFTEYDFHCQVAKLLDFGEYYGNNLDALWDVLTTDVERPINLIWCYSAISRHHLGEKSFQKIVKVLQDVQIWDKKSGLDERFEFELR